MANRFKRWLVLKWIDVIPAKELKAYAETRYMREAYENYYIDMSNLLIGQFYKVSAKSSKPKASK